MSRRPPAPRAAFAGRMILDDAWRREDFSGRRVAVVGPGREVACVVPAALRSAERVTVFLDEPDWLLPAGPAPVRGALGALGRVPALDAVLTRPVARLQLRRHVDDAWTRRLLTPHRFSHRRPGVDLAFYDALADPRCRFIAWPVYAMAPQGVRTAEGIEHRVDVVVLTPAARIRAELREPATAASTAGTAAPVADTQETAS
ncbi:hypothetical protein GCM10022215_07120 [Nocardioides fonticola]|uniref:Flavoprotein n=1 Tax=Nocardioides fonticola TaxID=450363 RepID=A0ABP7XDP5_9ACTN